MTVDADVIAERVAGAIEETGEPITLRRLTGTQQIPMDVDCIALVATLPGDTLADGVTQADWRITISNREIARRKWPGPPRVKDQCILGGRVVTVTLPVSTTQIGTTIIKHVLTARG